MSARTPGCADRTGRSGPDTGPRITWWRCQYRLQIADLFLSLSLVVTTRGRGPYTNGEEYSSEDFYDIELDCACKHAFGVGVRALYRAHFRTMAGAQLVGTKTFGKGIIQNVIPFGAEEGFKLTISEYHTLAGVCIHGVGITPDFVVAQDRDFILSGARDKGRLA